ncbi:MAG: hypothetical protein J0H82_29165 [Alphaproteobacteria bacterium]|jgi:hypothetical protein|nr:hypothetical protein [Alphaproteobacteria bacterium]
MPAISGSAMIALWNGVDPARQAEYDVWHSREHVPERIGVPGMIGARRYLRTAGPLPRYLTLYDIEDISVLASAPYQRLLAEPTPWTLSMRPSFRGFMRLCCRREFSAGGGMGGVLGAIMLAEPPAEPRSTLTALLAKPGVTTVHLLLRDPTVADVPFTIGGDAPDFPRGGAILLEGFDEAGLASAAESLTIYRLAYAVDREDLGRLVPPAQS